MVQPAAGQGANKNAEFAQLRADVRVLVGRPTSSPWNQQLREPRQTIPNAQIKINIPTRERHV